MLRPLRCCNPKCLPTRMVLAARELKPATRCSPETLSGPWQAQVVAPLLFI